jgi:hypothetical protein
MEAVAGDELLRRVKNGKVTVQALDAVGLLRKKGFKARHMAEGVIEWRARGFRIELQPQESRA